MAKKEKKVSINAVDGVMKEHFGDTITIDWYGTEIVIKKALSLSEMLEFVASVVSTAYGEEYGYMPELVEFATKSNVIGMYTNVSLPANLEHRYKILYNTDLVDVVRDAIGFGQVFEMETAIDQKLKYLCDTNAMEAKKQMEEFVSSMGDLQEKASGLFSNISSEDVARVMGAFESGAFSEEKIVKAYLDQTAPADSEK